MNKKVITHVITKLELGGAQVNTICTFLKLDRNRFEAFLVCGPGGILNSEVENEKGFNLISCLRRPVHPFYDLLALLALWRLFRRIKPDIVHTHSTKAGILGRWAAFLARVPVIVHSVHGFSFSPFHPRLTRSLYSLAERITAHITDHFIFVAEHDLAMARKLNISLSNSSLVRSGFAFEPFIGNQPSEKTRIELDLPGNHLICGIIAPCKPQKGLEHLVQIAALVLARRRDLIFLLLGDGILMEKLRLELNRLGIIDNFRLPGFRRDIQDIIPHFDIGVSTALWEGLPQSLVQMRLLKIPLVASAIPGNAEVIHEGKNGFLIPIHDHEKFAAAILRLADDTKLRKKLGAYNEEDFSEWRSEKMVTRQEELYLELLKR